MRILVLGISGMLGNAVFRLFAASPGFDVIGTVRTGAALRHFREEMRQKILVGLDVDSQDSLLRHLADTRPEVVINCVGLVKQLADSEDPLSAIPMNSLLPHRLARMCRLSGARLIHISTDCVFSGTRGRYREEDPSDAKDLYGRSKFLGEVIGPNAITLRTSIIGHELVSSHGLVGWFLSQERNVKGYTRAIFSGLPTVELARVMRDVVIPSAALSGLYHVGAAPISKYDLLNLVAKQYGKAITIAADRDFVIDRSLDVSRFHEATGYTAPDWPELIGRMHMDYCKYREENGLDRGHS